MIPSGTLLYKLDFFENTETQTASGFLTKTQTLLFSCKAAKIKSTGAYKMDARELFKSKELVFKIRNNKLLKEDLIVKFDDCEYNISFFDRNAFDNSIIIYLEKTND